MKVLYMSGYTSDTMVRHGVLEAKVSFINKPFNAAALLQKVREVLDSTDAGKVVESADTTLAGERKAP
jgi:FixJ family two-component response regulator